MESSLSEKAFSEDGYIVDQSQCGGLRYGVWRSDRNGCGWIAAYNLLRATGNGQEAAKVSRALLRRSLLKGLIGTRVICLYGYLWHMGYKPAAALGRKKAGELAARAHAGILFYRHKNGWHFVCFLPADGDSFRFLNAWTGQHDPVRSMEAFFSTCSASRFVITLAV